MAYQFLYVLFLLLIICGLVILAVYAMKRFGGKTPILAGAQLGTPIGRVHLAPRVTLHYVRTGGRVLVIGVSQNSIATVAEFDAATFDDSTVATERDDSTPSFQEMLNKPRPANRASAPYGRFRRRRTHRTPFGFRPAAQLPPRKSARCWPRVAAGL